MSFKLTYSTMFNPPSEMHQRFDAALSDVRAQTGREQALFINGADVAATRYKKLHSPIDARWTLDSFAQADATQAQAAIAAAHTAFSVWRKMPAHERIRLLRKAALLIEERVYHIAAALTLEVGKNRMEALGEAQETADFFNVYCDDYVSQHCFDHVLPDDPLPDFRSHNRSVMKPHGVWLVITPFNFPFALAGGPVAAALVTGNTVVLKGSSQTPWAGRLLADCLRDAGLPSGVFNYLSGSAAEIGDVLTKDPRVAGITFTGSYEAGMKLLQQQNSGAYPKPCIAEMGGKNACIVSANGDLDRAATGIVRSAFGMGGQKCSALSRLYVDASIADTLLEKLKEKIAAIRIGDPCMAEHWLGPVISTTAVNNYLAYCTQLREAGAVIHSGAMRPNDLEHGCYVQPTLAEVNADHPLWQEEMFLPILLMHRVRNLDEAMQRANASSLGLTAGFYGSEKEVEWFLDHIEAGVTYCNRPQGATTGAWPGYQPFGGWKGSGNTGKAIASFYYLSQYLREQSQTVVE